MWSLDSDQNCNIGNEEEYEADVFICSGADFETLYPEEFAQFPLPNAKLQMMLWLHNLLTGVLDLHCVAACHWCIVIVVLKKAPSLPQLKPAV